MIDYLNVSKKRMMKTQIVIKNDSFVTLICFSRPSVP
jgi:hypothetical protein